MALLNITGIHSLVGSGNWGVTQYCPVTAQVLDGFTADQNGKYDPILNQHLQVYLEAGREPDSLGMRAPLVFWLVMCGWVSPQRVFEAMCSENAGLLREEDLVTLFQHRWILESLVQNWPRESNPLVPPNHQVEFELTAVRLYMPLQNQSKKRIAVHSNGGLVQQTDAAGNRKAFTMDVFTSEATAFAQRNGHIGLRELDQLVNEPALPALLSRPQILKAQTEWGELSTESLGLRWRDLVKFTFKALVRKNAGPQTAQLVFESISKGLDYFKQEARR